MFDNSPILVLIKHLLNEMEELTDLKRYQKPVRFILTPYAYETVKAHMEGTEYKPYNHTCDENNHFEGRPVIVQHGCERQRCLSGVITKLNVRPLKESPAGEKYLHDSEHHYFPDTLFAEIEYRLFSSTEHDCRGDEK